MKADDNLKNTTGIINYMALTYIKREWTLEDFTYERYRKLHVFSVKKVAVRQQEREARAALDQAAGSRSAEGGVGGQEGGPEAGSAGVQDERVQSVQGGAETAVKAAGGQAVKAGGFGGGRIDKEGERSSSKVSAAHSPISPRLTHKRPTPQTGRQQSTGELLLSLTWVLLIGDRFQETKVPIVKVAEGPKKANPETPKIVAEPKGKDKPQPNKKPPRARRGIGEG